MFTARSFSGLPLTHATSTVADGNMGFRFGPQEEVCANRARFLANAGAPLDDCVAMAVTFGTDMRRVTVADRGSGMRDATTYKNVDVLMTDDVGTGLFLLTADCLPVVYYDPVRHALALAHVGRVNVEKELPRLTVERMGAAFGSRPEDLLLVMGPAIHSASYHFDRAHIEERYPGGLPPHLAPFVHEVADGRLSVDIMAATRAQLVAAGVVAARIEDPDIDTGSDPAYFSHYRAMISGEPEGRFATVVMLQ